MHNIINVTADGWLRYDNLNIRCALGKNGVTNDKHEGDNQTPLGTFSLREVYYRPDRLDAPDCALSLTPLTQEMGWCDAPEHPRYNLPVTLPFDASHEQLWREDHRYDIIVPLGYNDDPPIAGKGSAIFFHLASEDYQGTEGCVAVSLEDMLAVLARVTTDTVMSIRDSTMFL